MTYLRKSQRLERDPITQSRLCNGTRQVYTPSIKILFFDYSDAHKSVSFRPSPNLSNSFSSIPKTSFFQVHYTTLALLLKFGSSANVRDNEGITPLHYVAMHCERKECAALLCAAGASVRYRNHGNVTAVHVARFAEVKTFLRQLERMPPRLEHLCLLVVRQELRNDLITKAQHLPLPKPLKDKILFKTLPRVL